jgi:hypothetical protein
VKPVAWKNGTAHVKTKFHIGNHAIISQLRKYFTYMHYTHLLHVVIQYNNHKDEMRFTKDEVRFTKDEVIFTKDEVIFTKDEVIFTKDEVRFTKDEVK